MKKPTKEIYNFPIKLAKIKTDGLEFPGRLAVIREDTHQPIAVVSDKYRILKHETIIDNFREALSSQKIQAKEKIEMSKGGARLFATYELPKMQYEVAKGDIVSMRIILKNSYDGMESFQLFLGAYRLVCSNGMIIGKNFFKFSQKHMTNIDNETLMGTLGSTISSLAGDFKDSMEIVKQMTGTAIKEDIFAKKCPELPKYIMKQAKEEYERSADKTVWGFYNSLTFAISHNEKKENPLVRFEYLKRSWSIATANI